MKQKVAKKIRKKKKSKGNGKIKVGELKELKEFASEYFDSKTFSEFEKFVDKDLKKKGNKKARVPRFEKSRTAGALSNFISQTELGSYNPDRIPIRVYERMSKDPQIAFGFALIKMPILALNFRIECPTKVQADLVDAAIRPKWKRMIKDMLESIKFGFAAFEKVFTTKRIKIVEKVSTTKNKVTYDDFAVVLKKLKPLYPGSVAIRINKHDDVIGVIQRRGINVYDSPTGFVELEYPRKSMIFTPEEYYGNVFGEARFKNVYKDWYWGEVIYQFMLKYYERRGIPPIKARAPTGRSTDTNGEKVDNFDVQLEAARSLISDSITVQPSEIDREGNFSWDLDYMKDDQRGEMFVAALELLDSRKLRGLFIPERAGTQGSSSGSFSMAEAHSDMHIMMEEGFIKDIEDTINESIVQPIYEYNYPPNERTSVKLKIERMSFDKRRLMARVVERMLMLYAGAIRNGQVPASLPDMSGMLNLLEIPVSDNPVFKAMDFSKNAPSGKKDKEDKTDEAKDDKVKEDQNNQTKIEREKNTVKENLERKK